MNKKKKSFLILIIIFVLISLYSVLIMNVEDIKFFIAFEEVFSSLINEIWIFITNPTVFIVIIVFALACKYKSEITNFIGSIDMLKVGNFSTTRRLTNEISNFLSDDKQFHDNDLDFAEKLIDGFDDNFIDFLLDINGKSLTSDSVTDLIIKNNVANSANNFTGDPFDDTFAIGIFATIHYFIINHLFSVLFTKETELITYNFLPGIKDLVIMKRKALLDK